LTAVTIAQTIATMATSKDIARQARIESLARMVIAGQTMKQAAETLGVHYNTVRLDAKTPLFRETLERIREQSREKAEEMLTEAVVDIVAELSRRRRDGRARHEFHTPTFPK
jgi:hypothetical protein